MWQDYFENNIAVINLKHRVDRLQSCSAILDEFGVKYEVVEAVENKDAPCEGLVVTMQRYFKKVLDNGGARCFIFEDDILNLTDGQTFNDTMDKAVQQIHVEWDMLYAGCQPTSGMTRFYTDNLIPLDFAYATHACGYSKKVMKFVVEMPIHEPVDNFLVREFHQRQRAKIFVTYPMLMTQRPCYSDIGKAWTDWSPYMERSYDQQVIRLITDRNNAARR